MIIMAFHAVSPVLKNYALLGIKTQVTVDLEGGWKCGSSVPTNFKKVSESMTLNG